MSFNYAYTLPPICSVLYSVTFLSTYIISVSREDVAPILPYISDTGTWSPQSCFFGFMLSLGAFLQGVIVYVRYLHVEFLLKTKSLDPCIRTCNFWSFCIGVVASLGVCGVGSFQETNVLIVHLIGGLAAFGGGSIYMSLQTYISFLIYPTFGYRSLNIIRILSSLASAIFFGLSVGFGVISIRQFDGKDPTKWTKDQNGYVFHILSTSSEWLLLLSLLVFLLLFTKEFRSVQITKPRIDDISVVT